MLVKLKKYLRDEIIKYIQSDFIDIPLQPVYDYFERRMNKFIYFSGTFMKVEEPKYVLWVVMYNIVLAVMPFLVYILTAMTLIKINLELPSLIFLGHYICLVFITGTLHIHITLNRGEVIKCFIFIIGWEKLNRDYYSETNMGEKLKKIFKNNFPWMVWGSWALYMGIMPVYDYFVNSNPYSLPLPLWFPFDTTHSIGFLAGYIFEILSVNALCVQVNTLTPAFVDISFTVLSEYDVLIDSIRTLHIDAISMFKNKYKSLDPKPPGYQLYADPQFLFYLRKQFKEIIEHHQKINRFMDSLQAVSGVGLTIIFGMGSLIVACATVFIYIGDISLKITLGALLALNIITGGIMCYLGEQIHSQGEKVREELYFTNWYDWPEDMKRSLRIMLARTLNPPSLCGAYFTITPNYETIATVLNGAYSLMNLLIAFK